MKRFSYFAALLVLVAGTAFAQTTANLTGTVTHDGSPLPGVGVTIESPQMQGTRTEYTDVNGNYRFQSIPAGTYTVTFVMEGMTTVTQTARVGVAQTGRADADLQLSAVAEAITVTAAAPAVLETTEVQTNYEQQTVDELPMGRTVTATALLAPGTTSNGPRGAMQISGSFANDNLIMVNGAVIQENLRGQADPLFIEDAIQETTVLTGAVSAEYGRFTGGIVSSITKSGGNEFTGSFRDNFDSIEWQEASDFPGDEVPEGEINEVYEGTLGGRIIRDRLWFFTAGRFEETENLTSYQFRLGNPRKNISTREHHRLEGKLTGQITQSHNIVASYMEAPVESTNNIQLLGVYEEQAIDSAVENPYDFFVAHYSGILTPNLLVEGQYSQKNFAFVGYGGENSDLYEGTPGVVWQGGLQGQFNAPYFCGTPECGDEERNNEQYGAKGTYYLSTSDLGTHNIVAGYENWLEYRLSNNFQSPTNLTVWLYSVPPTYDAAADQYTFTITNTDTIEYFPIEFPSLGSELETSSFYVNDKWDLNEHWSFNLGVRYDANDAVDSFGQTTADDSAFSPRVAAIFDPSGDGRIKLQASYNQYVGRLAETVQGASSPAGDPYFFMFYYGGPEFSGTGREVIQTALDWFFANGGYDRTPDYASIGGVNTKLVPEGLVSPNVTEWTFGGGFQIGTNGYIRADYIDRSWNDYYVEMTNLETGTVIEPQTGVEFDVTRVGNSDAFFREYQAVQLSGQYRLFDRVNIGGNYTWSELTGNAEGEGTAGGPQSTGDWVFEYPEFNGFAQNAPVGFLSGDQTHKLRLWGTVDIPTPVGTFNVGLLQRFDSGTPYSAVSGSGARVQAVRPELAELPYVSPPSFQTYYFSERGEYRWDDFLSTDLSLNYYLPISAVTVFVQGEVFNVLNEQAVLGGNTTVITRWTSLTGCGPDGQTRCQAFDPFTETPVEGVHYALGENFGQPTSPSSYQNPRSYRFSVGLRF
ncbi:MAG: TonB-dependent receptor [Thermoanaerobaculia bacterium]